MFWMIGILVVDRLGHMRPTLFTAIITAGKPDGEVHGDVLAPDGVLHVECYDST